jgi:hypothetical protein
MADSADFNNLDSRLSRAENRIGTLTDFIDGGIGGDSINYKLKIIKGQLSNHRLEIHSLKTDLATVKALLYVSLFLQAINMIGRLPWE